MIRAVALANSKLYFVDFKDSFTHNILAYLKSSWQCQVVEPCDVHDLLSTEQARFIWGPGPGRADEYGIDLSLLRSSLLNSNHRHLGICLGHQLIGLALGGTYRTLGRPLHGVSLEITLPEWSDWGFSTIPEQFQFYNSLVIDINENEGLRVFKAYNSVMMLATKTVLSCQFHPESVGTSCPERFFSGVMKNFL
ncbi:MAG: aminodeoxychorismate/anthranilate synthase component II [bacterium]